MPTNDPLDQALLFVALTANGGSSDDAADTVDRMAHSGLQRGTEMKLPMDLNPVGAEAVLDRLGFFFTGQPIDDVFQMVIAPDGWRLRRTDHPMWSELLDPSGAVRGMLFHKAAFYDRSAHLDLLRRYRSGTDLPPNDAPRHPHGSPEWNRAVQERQYVLDGKTGERAWEGEWVDGATCDSRKYGRTETNTTGRGWLDEHRPGWENPGAYWDQA